ncbi:unnamed protein product [Calypogeia fissa]
MLVLLMEHCHDIAATARRLETVVDDLVCSKYCYPWACARSAKSFPWMSRRDLLTYSHMKWTQLHACGMMQCSGN